MNKVFIFSFLCSLFFLSSCGIEFKDLSTTYGEEVNYQKGLLGLKNPVIFSDSINGDFWGFENSKCKKASISPKMAYKGTSSIYVKWKENDCVFNGFGTEWDGGIGKNLSNLSDASFIFYLKNASATSEVPAINIAFEDFNNSSTKLSIKDYVTSMSSDGWTKVSIPLSDFDQSSTELFSVKQLVISFDDSGEVYMDELQFVSNK